MHTSPSSNLHFPSSARPGFDWIQKEIRRFVLNHQFPSLAALRSIREGNYLVGIYEDFGDARFSREMQQDLSFFVGETEQGDPDPRTHWAVYLGEIQFSEIEFEAAMYNELSHISGIEKLPEGSISEPGFYINIDGQRLHVTGLHPGSKDPKRQFQRPALVFKKA